MDLLSFEKGIAVAPVFWVAFGAIVYGLFCAGKQLWGALGHKL
jgi:hypothetical protein